MKGFCKCDRCGAVYNETDFNRKNEKMKNISINVVYYDKEVVNYMGKQEMDMRNSLKYDICPNCYIDFEKWLKGENKNDI